MDGRDVLAEVKTPTTADVTGGIVAALRALRRAAGVAAVAGAGVMIGTTHFTNAVVEARRPAADRARPARAAGDGGAAADGRLARATARGARRPRLSRATAATSSTGARSRRSTGTSSGASAADIAAKGIRSVAISSVFSPGQRGVRAARRPAILGTSCRARAISLSHEIGRIGLLERENATIMNACLRDLAAQIVEAFHAALAELGIEAPRLPHARTTAR